MCHPHPSFHCTAPPSPLSFHHKASKAQPLVSVGSVINTVGVRSMSTDCQNLSSPLNPGQKTRTLPATPPHIAFYGLASWKDFFMHLHLSSKVLCITHLGGRRGWTHSSQGCCEQCIDLITRVEMLIKDRGGGDGLGRQLFETTHNTTAALFAVHTCQAGVTVHTRNEICGRGRPVKLVLVETKRVCNRSKYFFCFCCYGC